MQVLFWYSGSCVHRNDSFQQDNLRSNQSLCVCADLIVLHNASADFSFVFIWVSFNLIILDVYIAKWSFHCSGHCLLFSGGHWQEDDGLLNISWANKFYCVFPIITGIVILILSAVQIYRLTKLYHKEEESSFLWLFMDAFFSLMSCAMVLTSAIFITLGFIVWCGLMNERFPSCNTADGQNITKSDVKIRTNGFYTQMGVSQFGGWSSFATWVGLSTFAILKLINNHQLRNLRVSMYLERQRLVNEDNFRADLTDAPRADSSSDWDDDDLWTNFWFTFVIIKFVFYITL